MLRRFLKPRRSVPDTIVPPGQRVYAIGDIHGRLDLLDDLLGRIDADTAARGPADVTLIFLGDLVDRGPDSAGVVERLRRLRESRVGVRVLTGNHEEVFSGAMAGEDRPLRLFCRIGGRETAISYGIAPDEYDRLDYDDLARRLMAVVPARHREFLATFEDIIQIGDYAFVHAGVRPEEPLDRQETSDLRWIRSSFLEHRGRLEKLIVHGHTITEEVEFRPHRIGIDTGAYLSGVLTALGLEDGEQWLLQSEPRSDVRRQEALDIAS